MEPEQPANSPNPNQSIPDTLINKEGDSPGTRREKSFLRDLFLSQKLSLVTFALLVLAVPITTVAVMRQIRSASQAKTQQPAKPIMGFFPTTTPTPTPLAP